MEKIAVLDLGSNTFNLLLATVSKGGNIEFCKIDRQAVKLGRSGYKSGTLDQQAIENAVNAIRNYKTQILAFGANTVLAAATDALRKTSNGEELKRKLELELGHSIHVINGQQEAYLIAAGVMHEHSNKDDITLIMDVGGGSTEFILYQNQHILNAISLPLGVSRLKEELSIGENLDTPSVNLIDLTINTRATDLLTGQWPLNKVTKMIGSSGAFDTFLALLGDQNKLILETNQFKAFLPKLYNSTYKERLQWPHVPEYRAELLHIGGALINWILKLINVNHIAVSSNSLKEGILYNYVKHKDLWLESL